jgi:urease alpha subunit
MNGNSRAGSVTVDHRTTAVALDGEPLLVQPAQRTALSRLYFL